MILNRVWSCSGSISPIAKSQAIRQKSLPVQSLIHAATHRASFKMHSSFLPQIKLVCKTWMKQHANIWLGIPFNLILLSAGVAGLPEDVYEAATVDGANGIQKLIYITIPLLKSTILAVLMLGFIYTLRVFDLIWIITKGGPGSATEVLPTFAYRLSFINFNFGRSAAVSVIMLLILLGGAILYLRAITEEERL